MLDSESPCGHMSPFVSHMIVSDVRLFIALHFLI